VGLVFGMWGRGIEEGGGDSLEAFGRWRTFTSNVKERMDKKICILCVILMEDG